MGIDNKSEKKDIMSNFIWRFLERCGAQGVTLIVSIVLARLRNGSIGHNFYNNNANFC